MDKYYILMGDIVKSSIHNSDDLWNKFNTIINDANSVFSNKTLSKLEIKITIGDEFQVVMKDIRPLLDLIYYLDISFLKEGINCRYAIGFGSISGDINTLNSYNMMGSGLNNTNRVLNYKKNKNKFRFFLEDDIVKEISLNALGMLLEYVMDDITNKQLDFLYLKVVKQKTDQKISNILKVSQRNIYRLKNKSNYNIINESFQKINLIFNIQNKEELNKYFEEYNLPILEDRGNH